MGLEAARLYRAGDASGCPFSTTYTVCSSIGSPERAFVVNRAPRARRRVAHMRTLSGCPSSWNQKSLGRSLLATALCPS
jgi:hypothetical protein